MDSEDLDELKDSIKILPAEKVDSVAADILLVLRPESYSLDDLLASSGFYHNKLNCRSYYPEFKISQAPSSITQPFSFHVDGDDEFDEDVYSTADLESLRKLPKISEELKFVPAPPGLFSVAKKLPNVITDIPSNYVPQKILDQDLKTQKNSIHNLPQQASFTLKSIDPEMAANALELPPPFNDHSKNERYTKFLHSIISGEKRPQYAHAEHDEFYKVCLMQQPLSESLSRKFTPSTGKALIQAPNVAPGQNAHSDRRKISWTPSSALKKLFGIKETDNAKDEAPNSTPVKSDNKIANVQIQTDDTQNQDLIKELFSSDDKNIAPPKRRSLLSFD